MSVAWQFDYDEVWMSELDKMFSPRPQGICVGNCHKTFNHNSTFICYNQIGWWDTKDIKVQDNIEKATYFLYDYREFVLASVTKPIFNIEPSNFVINKSANEIK